MVVCACFVIGGVRVELWGVDPVVGFLLGRLAPGVVHAGFGTAGLCGLCSLSPIFRCAVRHFDSDRRENAIWVAAVRHIVALAGGSEFVVAAAAGVAQA